MKTRTYIFSIICSFVLNLNFSLAYGDDRNKTIAAKKTKRDDTCHIVIKSIDQVEEDSQEVEITEFPYKDLYNSWDVNSAHPYLFKDCFVGDSIQLDLVGANDCDFVMPFKGTISSSYGWRKYRPHYGTDIILKTGEQVVTAFDGMVRMAKYYKGYGNCVIVRHKNGLETVYAHLSKIKVKSGEKLIAGSVIGLGGNTGRSFGSHLHFEFRYLGQAIDSQDLIDYEKGILKSKKFVVRKCDVEDKYDLKTVYLRNNQSHKYYVTTKIEKAKNGIHVVHQGDTLERIAIRNGTTIKAICIKNKIKPTSILNLGQKIKV